MFGLPQPTLRGFSNLINYPPRIFILKVKSHSSVPLPCLSFSLFLLELPLWNLTGFLHFPFSQVKFFLHHVFLLSFLGLISKALESKSSSSTLVKERKALQKTRGSFLFKRAIEVSTFSTGLILTSEASEYVPTFSFPVAINCKGPRNLQKQELPGINVWREEEERLVF